MGLTRVSLGIVVDVRVGFSLSKGRKLYARAEIDRTPV